jgi:hypothetical protein
MPFMPQRKRVGGGPSGKTSSQCPPQRSLLLFEASFSREKRRSVYRTVHDFSTVTSQRITVPTCPRNMNVPAHANLPNLRVAFFQRNHIGERRTIGLIAMDANETARWGTAGGKFTLTPQPSGARA